MADSPSKAHVSCGDCGLIFHPEDLDKENRCEGCAKDAAAAAEPKPANSRRR